MRALYDSKSKSIDDRGLKALMDPKAKYQAWLDVEAALATAQGEFGVIPAQAAEHIAKMCQLDNIDLAEVERLKAKIGHGFVPFLKVLTKACDEESGKYVHFGVTTQNIQQTAQLLIIKKIQTIYLSLVSDILDNLAVLAETHKHSVMPGRTHGRHAIPITYGYKVSVWISEILESVQRIQEAEKRIFKVMMGGAIGAFNASGDTGRKVQHRVSEILGMYEMEVPSRNISTHKVEYIMDLCLLVSTCHKMAEEVYTTSLEEIAEVSEGAENGVVGSSTMPHKINPKLAKGIIANAQKLYSLPAVGLYSCPRPYEGDSTSYMLFDGLLDEALALTSEVLLRMEELTRLLFINKSRMLANVHVNHGLDNSEFIMMKMAEKLGKDRAHSLVYQLAMEVAKHGHDYYTVLSQDPLINSSFSEEELRFMLDPANYTGLSAILAQEMADKARQVASQLKTV